MSAGSWSWSRSGLLAAGSVAALIWILGLDWFHSTFLTLFGANDGDPLELDGPLGLPLEWWDDLPFVAGVLGLIAIAAALLRNRAAVLVLAPGAAYLVAWLIDPPRVFEGQGASDTTYQWPAYVATAAIAIAAVAAARGSRSPTSRRP